MTKQEIQRLADKTKRKRILLEKVILKINPELKGTLEAIKASVDKAADECSQRLLKKK